MKKRVFIGSSTEELRYANIIKEILDKDFDVTIWNEKVWSECVFKLNHNYLSDLLRASLQYDFGILIGTKDDVVKVRDKEMLQPRDNILFEFGLFLGRLGISKCAFLIDKDIKILSDLHGITLAKFNSEDPNSFTIGVNRIRDLFLSDCEDEINFFPSATLAAVYYENFIVPTCNHLINNNGFTKRGVTYNKYSVNIIIPDKINDDVNSQFEMLKRRFQTETVNFSYAGRPRTINVETQLKDGSLEIIDFPTVISGIRYAISNLLPDDFNKSTSDCQAILDRELIRFETTLTKLLHKGGFDSMVFIKKESSLS